MFLKVSDLKNLIELEKIIYEIGIGKVKSRDLEKVIAPYYHKLYELIERLLEQRKTSNEKNYNRIKEKRKINKDYAR